MTQVHTLMGYQGTKLSRVYNFASHLVWLGWERSKRMWEVNEEDELSPFTLTN